MEKPNFQEDLKRAIDGKGLTIPSFADKTGVSSNAVLKWLKGSSFPKADKWAAIKRPLGSGK